MNVTLLRLFSSYGRRPIIAIACAASLSILWAAIVYDLERTREGIETQAHHDTYNLALGYQEHIRRLVGDIDLLMASVNGVNAETESWSRLPSWSRNRKLLAGATAVSMAGPDGIVQASTLSMQGMVDVSDRPHFSHHLDPHASQPFIGVPSIGKISGQASIQITRRIEDKNGIFRGILIVTLDPKSLTNFLDRADLGKQSLVAVIGEDGIVRARRSRDNGDVGQNLANAPVFEKIKDADRGTFQTVSKTDGVKRIFGYARVPGYPLVVTIGVGVDEMLSGWRDQQLRMISAGGLLSVAIILLTAGWVGIRDRDLRRRIDITAAADAKIHAEKTRLDATLDNLSHGVLMFDADARLQVWNRQYRKMYSLAPDSLCRGWTFRELVHHREKSTSFVGDAERYCAVAEADFASRKAALRIVNDVNGRTIRIAIRPIADGGWVMTHEDITDRIKAEAAIQESQSRFAGLFELAPDGLLLVNSKGEIQLANSEACRIFQYDAAELLGKPIELLVPAADEHRKLRNAVGPKFEPRKMGTAARELLGLRKDGSVFPIEVNLGPLMIDGEQNICAALRDVTERKKVVDQLQQAQKMEAVGQLTGGLAHDFNNLLMIMIGNLECLQEMLDHPDQGAVVDSVLGAANRGAELIQRLLVFSRRQPLQPKLVNINELLHVTFDLLSRTLGENISISLKCGIDIWPISIDHSQLESAVVNIAINARDAMPGGGALTITTENVLISQNDVSKHPGLATGEYTALVMSDNGSGMPPEVLAHVFEPFFTTKKEARGSGLGLSMVYGFVKHSGGYVTVESEVGRGTTIRMLFPRAEANTDSELNKSAHKTVQRLERSEVILAVDDNADVRATAVRNLRALGYRVLVAEDAEAALEAVDSAEKIDLLFTDIIMPGGMDGFQLAKKARLKRPGLKVLYTSGFPGADVEQGEIVEMDAPLLHKPYRKQALMDAITQVLAAA